MTSMTILFTNAIQCFTPSYENSAIGKCWCGYDVFTHFYHSGHTVIDTENLYKKLINVRLKKRDLQTLFKAMRVFAWHECITTIMVSHDRIARRIIKGLKQGLKLNTTVNHLAVEVAEQLAKEFFSEENDGDFYRVFGVHQHETE